MSKRFWAHWGPVRHKMGKRYTRTKAQALELEANSILWAVEFRPLLSAASKKPLYMPLYACVSAVHW